MLVLFETAAGFAVFKVLVVYLLLIFEILIRLVSETVCDGHVCNWFGDNIFVVSESCKTGKPHSPYVVGKHLVLGAVYYRCTLHETRIVCSPLRLVDLNTSGLYFNQSIGLTCKPSPGMATLMHDMSYLEATRLIVRRGISVMYVFDSSYAFSDPEKDRLFRSLLTTRLGSG